MTENGDWRRSRWEATHRRIYEAAMGLFQEKGFERVSIGELVAASGVSVPTFYAHFPSKEHVVMQLPTAEQMAALVAALPEDLPLAARLRRMAPTFIGQWTHEEEAEMLTRWKVVAGSPALRMQAATFERTTAGLIADALLEKEGATPSPAVAVMVDAYMAAFTRGLLAWADSDGSQDLQQLIEGTFDALQRGSQG